MTFDIDDPRLTSFALGELPEAERPDIEKALADHPDLAREVEQIRLTARWLSERLHEEQAREAAPAVAAVPPLKLVAETPNRPWFWRRYPWMSAAAAVLLVGVSAALVTTQSARRGLGTLPSGRYPSPRAAGPELFSSPAKPGAVAAGSRLSEGGAPAAGLNVAANTPAAPASEFFALSQDNPAAAPAPTQLAFGREPIGVDQNYRKSRGMQPGQNHGQGPRAAADEYAREFASQGRGRRQAQGQVPPQGEPDQQGQPGQPGAGSMMGMGGMMGGMMMRGAGPADADPGMQLGNSVALRAADATSRDKRQAGQADAPGDQSQPSASAAPAESMPALALKKESEARQDFDQRFADPYDRPEMLADADVKRDRLESQAIVERESKDGQAAPQPIAQPAPVPVVEENPFVLTSQEAASTFAIDVDTASYSIVRRSLMEQQRLPSPDEVRIEEMINYFPYQDAPPPAGSPDPFAIHIEAARCPWNAANRLARVGIMGRPLGQEARKPSNLVFLVDVSGSMDQPNKLPLVQWGLQKLVEQLGENDRVAIAVYAGSSGLVLPSTSAMNKPAILSKIEELRAGGSTNGGAGIQLAYDQAAAGFINGGINRVILATDGDFNVGVTSQDELVTLIESKAKGPKPVFLTVLGFGMDNLKDGTLEKLADKGNGHYAYIDRPEEAYKVLVEEMGATLDVIAKDVKIQVEFKPELVRAYRLVGYENRVMPNQDFRDDQKDGGEIGAGHHVTALYEYVPAEAAPAPPADGGPSPASFTVRLRYKQPEGEVATEIERPVVDRGVDYADASDDFKFASSVAGFGMILRHSPSVGSLTLPGVVELASPTLAHDPGGYRREFMGLVQRARDIQTPPIAGPSE